MGPLSLTAAIIIGTFAAGLTFDMGINAMQNGTMLCIRTHSGHITPSTLLQCAALRAKRATSTS